MDITTIPIDQLIADREASDQDITICQFALASGITNHKDGMPVQYRLDTNKKIIEKIDAELKRRNHKE